jgi:hemerythrin-like metal-binding protein
MGDIATMVVGWDPALALGHAEMDEQHRELFRRFAALVAAMETGERADVGALFDHLGGYVARHFAAEEQVMERCRFPGAKVHAALHARFVRELGELRALYEGNGAPQAVAVKARTWIGDWLRTHIVGVDHGLAAFLRGA